MKESLLSTHPESSVGFKADFLIFQSCSGKTPVDLKIACSAVVFPLTSQGSRIPSKCLWGSGGHQVPLALVSSGTSHVLHNSVYKKKY